VQIPVQYVGMYSAEYLLNINLSLI
jgi:hypothetical protein